MKKFACFVLALAMVFSLGISASAASPIQALGGTDSNTVTVKVEASAATTVYYVEVSWDSLYFQYNFSGQNWDPTTHQYSNSGGWTTGTENPTANITVTNHSNAAVTANVKFVENEVEKDSVGMVDGVTASLSNNSIQLATAVGTTFANAPSGVAKLTISGAPTNNSAIEISKDIVVKITTPAT